MTLRRAALRGLRLAKQARCLSVAGRSAGIAEASAGPGPALHGLQGQLAISRCFAAAAEPAAAPQEGLGFVSQVGHSQAGLGRARP